MGNKSPPLYWLSGKEFNISHNTIKRGKKYVWTVEYL